MSIQHHRQPTSTLEARTKSSGACEHLIQKSSQDSTPKSGTSSEGHHLSFADWLHWNALVEN